MFNTNELHLIVLGLRAAVVRLDKQLQTTNSKTLKEIRNLKIASLLTLEQKVYKHMNTSAKKVEFMQSIRESLEGCQSLCLDDDGDREQLVSKLYQDLTK